MADRPTTAAEARELMLDWAGGKRSWTNTGHSLFSPTAPHEIALREQMIAVMDAQEVVKWSAVYQAMAAEEQLKAVSASLV